MKYLSIAFLIALCGFFSISLAAEEGCICTMQYDPVCGVDGKTYGNACSLACAGIAQAYAGECTEDTVSDIPMHCTSRYDGCNTCQVSGGVIGGCTKMACFTMNTPECLEYDFTYLTTTHTAFIEQKVTAYLQKFDEQTRLDKIDILRTKISAKKTEINNILMVSLFMPDSLELKKYHLMLEVLDFLETIL